LISALDFPKRRLLALQHDVTKLFEPDVLVDRQFFHTYRAKHPSEPERALLFAVLSEAIETFRKFAFSKSARGQSLFRQAEAWLWDKDPDYFFSCKNICELMGLDPCYLRRGLLQWAQENKASSGEREANKLAFSKIGRTQHRTVYKQRRSAMHRSSRDSKTDARRDADHSRTQLGLK
jgi:hypothetical protein